MATSAQEVQQRPMVKSKLVEVPGAYQRMGERRAIVIARMMIPDGAEIQAPKDKKVINYGRTDPDLDSSSVVIFDASMDEGSVRSQIAANKPF